MKKLLIALFMLSLVTPLLAQNSGPREVLNVGCHRHDHTCYMTISGDPVGPEACSSISIRWNKNDANGDAIFSLVTSAFYANRKVSFTPSI